MEKRIIVSDLSGQEIPDKERARITIQFADLRKQPYTLDVTDAEALELAKKGTMVPRAPRGQST